MKAFFALTRAGLRAFVRDRGGLVWSFVFPILFIVVFGALFGRADRPQRIKIGLVMEDSAPASEWMPGVFESATYFEAHRGTRAAETTALGKGERSVVVVFPAGLGEKIARGETGTVEVITDPSSQQTGPMAAGVVQQFIAGFDKRLSGAPTLLETRDMPLSAPGDVGKKSRVRGIDFLLPGILAMTIMQLGLFTAIPLINMREKGILKRLRATPLPRATIIGSQVAQRLIIGVVQTLVIVGIGATLYKFRITGSWPIVLATVTFGVLTFVSIGAVLSALAKTQESGMPLVQLANFPQILLSGLFFPTDLMPASIRPIQNILPATYMADLLRHVMLGAPSVHPVWVCVAVLGAWMIGSLIVASRIFRWE